MTSEQPDWYLRHQDLAVHGPYTLAALLVGARIGNIAVDSEVRHVRHTRGQWVHASRVKPIAEVLAAAKVEPVSPPVTSPSVQVATSSDDFSLNSIRNPLGRKQLNVPATFAGAFMALFDFRFKYFITPWIIKLQWAVCVAIVISFLGFVLFNLLITPLLEYILPTSGWSSPFTGSQRGPRLGTELFRLFDGLIAKIFAVSILVWFCIGTLLYVRLLLESIIVFFRIAEDITQVRHIAARLENESTVD